MTTTPEDTAIIWRDLRSELTPNQIARLEAWEAQHPGEDSRLLVQARAFSQGNVATTVMLGHLPEPDGAVRVCRAQEQEDGTWAREFVGTDRTVAGVSVTIEGVQHADGRVERDVLVGVDDLPDRPGGALTAEQARELGQALLDAAAELDRLQR